MPELPEVECVRRTLEPQILGRTVNRVITRLPKLARPSPRAFAQGLGQSTVVQVRRHGKLLILGLDRQGSWAIHLGMTGQVILAPQKPQAKHVHITVSFTGSGPKLYFRDPRQFGFMAYCPDEKTLHQGPLANYGPDALLITPQEFISRLKGRRAPIKALLLDQRILAGVGNIYADESLHLAHIHPQTPPAALDAPSLQALHRIVQKTLHRAVRLGGSSISNFVDAKGRPGTFQQAHLVYKRSGQPCRTCGQTISRVIVAGRSTHFCAACQVK